nr:hypothetical protein [Tanacetum cinerariifolium]
MPPLFINLREDERVEETLMDPKLTEYTIKDTFDSKEDKIKESKLLIDELDPPRSSDFLPSPKYDSFLYEDFSETEYIFDAAAGDSILKDSIDPSNLADLNDNLVDTMPEIFTDEHALDYSSPPLYDEYDDDLFEVESDTKYVYDDPFDSKGEKIKESKLLIDELDLPSDFLPPSKYDSFLSEDFFKVDALPLTNNEDNVFNPGILIQETLFEVITCVAPEKNEKKLSIYHVSLILEDFDPPLNELPCFK